MGASIYLIMGKPNQIEFLPADDDADPCTNELPPIILSVWGLFNPLIGSFMLSGNIKAPERVTAAPIAPGGGWGCIRV